MKTTRVLGPLGLSRLFVGRGFDYCCRVRRWVKLVQAPKVPCRGYVDRYRVSGRNRNKLMEMGERGGWKLAVKRDSDFEWLMLCQGREEEGRSKRRRRSGDKLDGRLLHVPSWKDDKTRGQSS